MEPFFFSIIIPVYNTANYVASCLNSILIQNLDQALYEVLLIDDGSSDCSYQVLREYEKCFKNVIVIRKVNEGVSIARNVGIMNSRGRYILFVDSDDSLGEDSLSNLYHMLSVNDVDILVGRSFNSISHLKQNECYGFPEEFLGLSFSGIQLTVDRLFFRGSVCGVAFSSDFLRRYQLTFIEGLEIAEDFLFFVSCCLYAQRVEFIDNFIYLINQREGSASRSVDFEKVFSMTNNLRRVDGLIRSNDWTNSQLSILNFCQYTVISNMFNMFYSCFSLTRYLKIVGEIRDIGISKLNIGDIKICRGKVQIFNISIWIFSAFVFFKQFINRGAKYLS